MASSAERQPGANRPRRRKPITPKPELSTAHPAPESVPPLQAAASIGDQAFMRYADPARRAELFRSLQSTYGNAAVERLARGLQPTEQANPAQQTPLDRALNPEASSGGTRSNLPIARSSKAPHPPVTSTAIGTPAGLQREDKPPPATLEEAIRGGDSSEFKRFRPFPAPLSTPMLSGICSVILGKIYVTGDDEKSLESAWTAYGAQNARLQVDLDLWRRCASRGANIDNVPWLKQLRDDFTRDVTALANQYLTDNLTLVEDEMTAGGIPLKEGEEMKPPTADQEADLQDMQAAAESVRRVQEEQERSREVYVGYSIEFPQPEGKQRWMPLKFDPYRKPERPAAPEFDANDPSPMKQPVPVGPIVATQDYDSLHAAYEKGTTAIENLVMVYPMLYAISREGKSADTKKFAETKDPKAAREQLAGSLKQLRNDINRARGMLGNELNPLDLLPVHENMYGGEKPQGSKNNWSTEFAKGLVSEQVKGHATDKALKALGYEALSQAAFMFGGVLPGAGGVAVMLVGLWASAKKANMSTEEYKAMLTASKTAVTPGTELVEGGQVETAKARSEADEAAYAMAFINTAVGIAGAAATWAQSKLAAAGPMTIRGRIPKVAEEVEIRTFPKSQNVEFEAEMAMAKSASENKTGPEFHGEVPAGQGRRAFATGSRKTAGPEEAAPESEVTGPPPGISIIRGPDGFPLSEHTARLEYQRQVALNPGREVGLVQHKRTGSWAVSIGAEAEVNAPKQGLYGKDVLRPSAEWTFRDHYHPNFDPKTGAFDPNTTHIAARLPSDVDMNGAFKESGTKLDSKGKPEELGTPVSERVNWLDYGRKSASGQPQLRSTGYGYVPGASRPFWVRFVNAAGKLEMARFRNVTEYNLWRGTNFYGH